MCVCVSVIIKEIESCSCINKSNKHCNEGKKDQVS